MQNKCEQCVLSKDKIRVRITRKLSARNQRRFKAPAVKAYTEGTTTCHWFNGFYSMIDIQFYDPDNWIPNKANFRRLVSMKNVEILIDGRWIAL